MYSDGIEHPHRCNITWYEGVSKSFRTGRLERELQVLQLLATMCSCIAILWVSPVSFAAVTLCVASQWVLIFVIVYVVIDSIRQLLVTPSYTSMTLLQATLPSRPLLILARSSVQNTFMRPLSLCQFVCVSVSMTSVTTAGQYLTLAAVWGAWGLW
jgi:hypothetical protein